MQKSYIFKVTGYLFTALILFFLVPLLFPFLGEAIQTISAEAYLFLYVDMSFIYWVLLSLICAVPVWYVLMKLTKKKRSRYVLGAQFFICSALVAIYYFNRHYLDELWIRPLYE